MAAPIHRITAREWLVAMIGFTMGLVCFSGLHVARHHIGRIETIVERFGAVHASYESPSLNGRQLFPPEDPWNTDISREPVDPNSDVLIAGIGATKPLHPDFGTSYNGQPWGIPYVVGSSEAAEGTG